MPPARHTRNNASTKDSHGYQEGVAKQRSTRLTAATNTLPGNVVDGKEAKGKEQPCPRVGGKPKAQEVQPHHPMPYPLGLSSRYEYVGHGRIELKDVGVAIASTEKEQALKALGFVLQAACDIVGRHPSSLDRNRDIIWDWRSIELSANAYGAFVYAMVNHKSLKYDTQNVSYDWTPIDSLGGTLSVRKECNFQSELTQQLSDVINEALYKNKLLTSLVRYVELESRIPTPVLTGIVEGLRMPCRCWRYEQSDKGRAEQKEEDEEKEEEEEAWPDDPVQDFVLEVGMGDKTPILSALADSYIKRGTLCVITVKFERYQESDFAWSYSIYRRGKARRFGDARKTVIRVEAGRNILLH
ncbi:MAG: hypothetical protein Q9212_007553, partial [Teloschistes hypoglaucus]